MEQKKKRLSMNLSFLALIDSTKQKSARTFDEPNGVVGLRILAALGDDDGDSQSQRARDSSIFFNCGKLSSKAPSNPIPIACNQNGLCDRKEIELCEEYTCVISHLGENLVEKREYFEADFLGNKRDDGDECAAAVAETFLVADYLSSCFLCNKLLHGLDIFMYRGEKAFCSDECRLSQISIDEKAERRQNRVRKQVECSVSPCSGALQFFAGVAAA